MSLDGRVVHLILTSHIQMLSVLIPVYNQDVRLLVTDVHFQCTLANISFEIILLEDGSTDTTVHLNRQVERLTFVRHIIRTENLGRSVTRNELLREATRAFVLFIDGDSSIEQPQYIATYVKLMNENTTHSMFYGGRNYSKYADSPDYYLHWSEGSRKEALTAEQRNAHPSTFFHSNNYMCSRSLHIEQTFDESLSEYGYEDLILAHCMTRAGVGIVHIDNPVKHVSLKTNVSYLHDLQKAMANLIKIKARYPHLQTRLIQTYSTLHKYKLTGLWVLLFTPVAKAMNRDVIFHRIAAKLVDMYKLYYFALLSK